MSRTGWQLERVVVADGRRRRSSRLASILQEFRRFSFLRWREYVATTVSM